MSAVTVASLAALAAGLGGAIQATVLGVLARRIGTSAAAAAGALTGALILAGIAVIAARGPSGLGAAFRQAPWLWAGAGVLGAGIVTVLTFAPPRIGTLGTFALIIAGNLAAAVLIDSLGLFGAERVPLTLARVGGLVLLAAGAALVLRR
ncbi:MAG TPA: DMT family transporter [Actinomycetota bacterium]|nr:DMT family transporter [Actinomycetota bacterium]